MPRRVPNHQVFLASEQDGQRKRPFETMESQTTGLHRPLALLEVVGDQMGHHFGVGFGDENMPLPGEFGRQRLIVLNNAVVNHRHPVGCVRMSVAFGGAAMSRPARVADTDRTGERCFGEASFQIDELTFGAPAFDGTFNQRRNTGAIITTVFETPQPLKQQFRDAFATDNSNNSAH